MVTYGTVKFLREQHIWQIECEPHVALRLKRVFGKLSQGSHGSHHLSDNPETCRDILWFLDRYPLQLPAIDESYLKHQAAQHRDAVGLVHQLLDGRMRPREFKLALPAKEHQRISGELNLAMGGLLNSDPLGMGKTLSGLIVFTDPRALPGLVVVPAHLQRQWSHEIRKFLPQATWHIIKKTEPYDLCEVHNGNGRKTFPDISIITYAKLSYWAETLAPLMKSVIFDEVDELHTGLPAKSKKYLAAAHLAQHTRFRTGLSATPINGHGSEIFHVIDCLRPGALGSWQEFLEEWCHAENGKYLVNDPQALGAFLRDQGLMLRRPGKTDGILRIPHYVECDMAALHKVSKSCEELARLLLSQGGESFRGQKRQASAEFSLKLRQATGLGKSVFVAEFVKMLLEQGERVLLSGFHHVVYDVWRDRLKDYEPVWFTGHETVRMKNDSVDRFMDKKSPLIVMSNRSGSGTDGLQTVCHVAVHGELDYSPAKHDQIDGRLDRPGQTEMVRSYFPIAESGSDPIIADILGIKKRQSDGIKDPYAALVEETEVDPDHIKKLAKNYLKQLKRR